MSLHFLNPDGTPSPALYLQSTDPIFFCETIPPSVRRSARSLVLDHRNWEALRKGQLNDLLLLFPKVEEIVLPVVDWGEMDTYLGTMQFTRLNRDRVVYAGEELRVDPLDKFEYDSWAEFKADLEGMGEAIITPGMLAEEVASVLGLAVAERDAGIEGRLVDVSTGAPKITVVGARRVLV